MKRTGFLSLITLHTLLSNLSAWAATELIYDTEPNDQVQQALLLRSPQNNDAVRIIGELSGGDQDAYYWSIDEEDAGVRWNIRLQGRAGALTRLDIIHLSDAMGGAGYASLKNLALDARPPTLGTLSTHNGVHPALYQDLLLKPGNYVLGVAHSGGEGSYSIEISRAGYNTLSQVPDENSAESPLNIRNHRVAAFMAQDETFYRFSLNEEEAEHQWAITVHTPLGMATDALVRNSSGEEVLHIQGDGGEPVRRSGLRLAAGDYHIATQNPALIAQTLLVSPGNTALEGQEVEPNDREADATEIRPGQSLSGSLGNSDRWDWLRLVVDEDAAGRLWNLNINSTEGVIENIDACLYLLTSGTYCRRATGGTLTLPDMGLMPGEYLIRLDPRGGQGGWQIRWDEAGTVEPGVEAEPNDTTASALAWPDSNAARGHFHGIQEKDVWRFAVSGEPQLWRAQLMGENLFELVMMDSSGNQLQKVRAQRDDNRIRLDNLYLSPGEYFVSASGTDADYRLLLRPLGPPDPDSELEPNDLHQNALPLAFGQRRNGILSASDDQDRYQFSLTGPEHIHIRVTPPADGAANGTLLAGDDSQAISQINNREPGRELLWDVYLPAGDYSVQLHPSLLSDAEYFISLERLPLFDGAVDREPNNLSNQASMLLPDGRVQGEVGQTRAKQDWFQLPDIQTATDIMLPMIPGIRLLLSAGSDIQGNQLVEDRENERLTATLQPGTDYALRITGEGRYDFMLFEPIAAPAAVQPSLQAEITFDSTPLAQAFSPWEQVLEGRLTLRNATPGEQPLHVETLLSDDRWQIEISKEPWVFDTETTISRSFKLIIPDDATNNYPTRLNIRVTDQRGQSISTFTEINTTPDVLPQSPRYAWRVPPALRGGLNVAGAALGGSIVFGNGIADNHPSIDRLIDGMTNYGRWTGVELRLEGGALPQPTVELAGDEPVPVSGFLINPTSTIHPPFFLREFAVALSMDGDHFETVLTGKLKPAPIEQAFPLPELVEARYARLIPLNTAFGNARVIKLGEFKVVAEPGFMPKHLQNANLATPELGGHLVWADPSIRDSSFDRELLIKDGSAWDLKAEGGEQATAVLGFHHARAAQVQSVSFDKLADVKPEWDISHVSIASSQTTPLGPFETIGEWELNGSVTQIDFEQPIWARYLQFRFHGSDGATTLTLPDRIAVWEAPITGDYRSILAEWGHYRSSGPLEARHEPQYAGPLQPQGNNSRENAVALTAGEPASGVALLDEYDAWYHIHVPEDQNTINLTLRGNPSLQARPVLSDDAGEPVALYTEENNPQEMHWRAFVEPGQSYWLRTFEPPRSLIFSWDTSASVGWYLPTLANALYRYAENVRPERDVVNLLPFGHGKPLLQNWQGESYPLKRILGSYSHDTSSSEAERAVAVASRALADRPPGKRGLLLLTDAATNADAGTWPALRDARTMVFSLAVSSEGALSSRPEPEQDLMQEWSRVNGGVYEYITSLGALQQGYERAISRMRQPVTFEVETGFTFTEDPGPATLRLISGDETLDPGVRGAVELILDASGSMLQRMDGEYRIEIAKNAIAAVVENVLPEGMPLALRVYGHREAGSCRTDLEQPLAPLDKNALLDQLSGINAVNLAKTPIADSLAQVGSDLSEASGRRRVILLTDGEETCGGDPVAVLSQLAEDGIDVRLNIIGFAIDDEALKDEFTRWAELGGGSYFDATEAEALQQAMMQSLQIPYTVKDDNGETVAEGVLDGETVELPAGRYLIELDTEPPKRFRNVDLLPGDALELHLSDGERL